MLQIIGRASHEHAAGILYLVGLSQHRLRKGGSRADKGNHPHPEDRARPADENRRSHTGNIAHANPCPYRGGKGLKGGNAMLAFLVTKKQPHHLTNQPHLGKSQADRQVQPCPQAEADQRHAPNQSIQLIHQN